MTQFDYHKIFNFIQDEPIRNKIGFRVIDSDHKQNGVRVVNSKIRAIIDGDIIDSINGKNIFNKKEFDEYMRNAKYTEEIIFHVNEPNDIGNATVFEPVKNKIGFTVIDSKYKVRKNLMNFIMVKALPNMMSMEVWVSAWNRRGCAII